MDIQLKKGILDVCVLKCIESKPSYGYKIITDLTEYIEISESTLYPILKRLEINGYIETYSEEHSGRLRKYYKINKAGRERLKDFSKEYVKINKAISFIQGENNE